MENAEEFEKEVNEIGLELKSSEDIKGPFLMMEADIATKVDYSELIEKDLVMMRKTKRNEELFLKLKSYENGILTLMFAQPCPQEIAQMYQDHKKEFVGTTFMDFCWYHSSGTTETTIDEINTPFRDDAEKGNLTWWMPVHACDNLIEVLHVLNQSFLEGILEESVIYGVKGIQ